MGLVVRKRARHAPRQPIVRAASVHNARLSPTVLSVMNERAIAARMKAEALTRRGRPRDVRREEDPSLQLGTIRHESGDTHA